MRVVVFGANGYLGRHLVLAASRRGDDVLATDNHPRSRDAWPNYLPLDVTDAGSWDQLDTAVDAIFFFAGLSGPLASCERPQEFVAVNESGLLGLLNRLRRAGSRARVVFPSSRLVYRGQTGVRLTEESPKECRSVYAATKLVAETYLQIYRHLYGLSYTVCRICVPYGNLIDLEYSFGTMGFFLRQAAAGKDVPLYGDGRQRRTFSHIEDVCRQVLAASAHPEADGRVFNVGGGDHLSLLEAALRVASRFRVGVTSVPWPDADARIESGDTMFDSSALESLIGFGCVHNIEEWLSDLPLGSAA
ncbi:MAG: NAD(P)-dependent oxidoreductase [Candidatus Riflebacteria bacterium]|nr:NAD(P)-dependent oxidoreductase [Candidatus Riflebacteria bacterium]